MKTFKRATQEQSQSNYRILWVQNGGNYNLLKCIRCDQIVWNQIVCNVFPYRLKGEEGNQLPLPCMCSGWWGQIVWAQVSMQVGQSGKKEVLKDKNTTVRGCAWDTLIHTGGQWDGCKVFFTFHCVWVVVWFEAWMETRTEQHISHEPEPWAHTRTNQSSIHLHAQQWVWVTPTSFNNITCTQQNEYCLTWFWVESPSDQDSLPRASKHGPYSWTPVCVCVCDKKDVLQRAVFDRQQPLVSLFWDIPRHVKDVHHAKQTHCRSLWIQLHSCS